MRMTFKARLTAEGALTILTVPFNVETTWGARGRLGVKGTLNGFPFRGSLAPVGNGLHTLMVNRETQTGARAQAGSVVDVVMEPDTDPRKVAVPPDLAAALAKDRLAQKSFELLSPSHQREFVTYVDAAKQRDARDRRIAQALGMMKDRKKPVQG